MNNFTCDILSIDEKELMLFLRLNGNVGMTSAIVNNSIVLRPHILFRTEVSALAPMARHIHLASCFPTTGPS
jgi:hypothetical protein